MNMNSEGQDIYFKLEKQITLKLIENLAQGLDYNFNPDSLSKKDLDKKVLNSKEHNLHSLLHGVYLLTDLFEVLTHEIKLDTDKDIEFKNRLDRIQSEVFQLYQDIGAESLRENKE